MEVNTRGGGQYIHPITVQKPATSGADTYGEIDLSSDANWTFVAERRANVIGQGGLEYREDHQQKSTVTHIVRTLGDTALRQADATWRFLWKDKGETRKLNIIRKTRVQEMPEILEFRCAELTT